MHQLAEAPHMNQRLSEEGVIRRVLLFIRGLGEINLFIVKRKLGDEWELETTAGRRRRANRVISLNERRNLMRCCQGDAGM